MLRHFAFAVEKLEEVREIADLVQLDDDAKRQSTALAANKALFDGSRVVADEVVRARIAALADADYVRRPERGERQRLQRERLGCRCCPLRR